MTELSKLDETLVESIRAALLSAPAYMIDNLAQDRNAFVRDVDADVLARFLAARIVQSISNGSGGTSSGG